jgi:outer membrane immunogenic protein
MRRTLPAAVVALSSFALVSFGLDSSAIAADMPVKAPPVVVPAYSWTGFYFGANLGYSVGRERTTDAETLAGGAGNFSRSESFLIAPTGAIGGGQVGYNWQVAPHWVLGAEADWQASAQRDTISVEDCCLQETQRLNSLATLRARAGYAQDGWLWYVTAGGAAGRIKSDISFFGLGAGPTAASFANWRGGWTAGTGVETSLGGNWSAKFEYLYVDLGTLASTVSTSDPTNVIISTDNITVRSRIIDNVFRVGLNYRPGAVQASAAPIAPAFPTKAPPLVHDPNYNWTGFYVGGNAGYSVGWDNFWHTTSFSVEKLAVSPAGAVAGGQIGYNYLFAPHLLAGVEADWDWTNQRHSSCTQLCTTAASAVLPAEAFNLNQKVDWLSTARVRVGYAQAQWLLYATVGAAWARVHENVSIQENDDGFTFANFTHNTKGGLAAGGGAEVALTGNLSAKLEYLYVNLGSWNELTGPVNFGFPVGFGAPELIREHLQDHIVRVGLNYQFGR